MTWVAKAVQPDGTVVATLVEFNVDRVSRSLNGRETAELTIPTLSTAATYVDLFSHELQLWLDGSVYAWLRPVRLQSSSGSTTDTLTVQAVGLASYFDNVLVGTERSSHITSPHLDTATVGNPPNQWTATANVAAAAIVNNNAEYHDIPKAIQLNNAETGEDAYVWQNFTVPAGLDGVSFAASARVFISDADGGSPAWGGPAYNNRGLTIQRVVGGNAVGEQQIAQITDETPRNQVVRLQTGELFASAGDVIHVRLYSPSAYVAWREVGLYDGEALQADRVDKSAAFVALVEHAQDPALGKQDRNIGTDVVSLGETVSLSWPYYRRDVIGEQIDNLADTFEYEMVVTSTTRTLRARAQVGTTIAGTITKADLVGSWSLGSDMAASASVIVRQGDGSGIARDEYWAADPAALGGEIVERLTWAAPGDALVQLRDTAEEQLDRYGLVEQLPSITIAGALAKTINPGDTVTLNLNHGWAQFSADARVITVELDGTTLAATLSLELA